jgi:hypothetical protein
MTRRRTVDVYTTAQDPSSDRVAAMGTDPLPPDIAAIDVPSPQLLKYYVLQRSRPTSRFP